MKVLLVNGSPHQKGCTHTALDVVAKTLNDDGIGCDEFWVGNQAVSGCLGCHRCNALNRCVLQDVVNECLEIAGDYDGFIFGTPVHWGGPSGFIVSFMDRLFYADLNGGGHRFLHKQQLL